MPTTAPLMGDDRDSLIKPETSRRAWSNFGHYTIDDWQCESSVKSSARSRPFTAGAAHSRPFSTANHRQVSSAAPGDIKGPRSYRALETYSNDVGRSRSNDSYDDSIGSDGLLDRISSSEGDAAQATPTKSPSATAINSANSVERRYIGENTTERPHSRETDSSSTRDIDNDMTSSWGVNKATRKTMATMMDLNNGLTLPSSHRLASAAESNHNVKPESHQGFNKTTKYKVQSKLPAFYVKPQHRHTYANAFLARSYSALKRGAWSGCVPAGVVSTHATVAFSKRSRAQILRRLQEKNEMKVDAKRKFEENTNMRAKVDSFFDSMTNVVATK